MQIEIADEFKQADSLLIVALSGTPQEIRTQLERLCIDMKRNKPGQGISIGADYTTQIITPVWNGKKY